MSEKFQMVAKTLQGLENVLAEELHEIGAENIELGCRGVTFSGKKETLYKSNFWLRTALRILKPIHVFNARTIDEFYGNARKFDWTSVMDISQKFAVESVVNSELFPHSRYIALKLKDAIADHFRDRFGKRPFVDPKKPHIQFHVHVNNDICTVSLDSSGESLHKRGYRVVQDVAPINEVLAAGLIKLSGWDGDSVFIDPMCGSGTIIIEAALIAYGIAPGIFRQHFGFENWLDFDDQLLQSIYNDDSRERNFEYSIMGGDISKQAIEVAHDNIRNAGLQKFIDIKPRSIFDFDPPEQPGIVITNPPYGERLRKEQLDVFYRQLGDCFEQRYTGYDIWLMSGNFDALKNFGLRPSFSLPMLNGAIDCKYQQFQMYTGSKKAKYKIEKK